MQQHSHGFLSEMKGETMPELKTRYMNLDLNNPLVASASTLSKKLDGMKAMEDAGISAIVLYSLFEEEIIHESLELNHFLLRGSESYAEAITYFPDLGQYNSGADKYLELIRKAKTELSIPIIGSLNGLSSGGWLDYARQIEQAGADALELNMYFVPTDESTSAQVLESAQIQLVQDIRKEISIPLAVKLSPFYSALPNFAREIAKAGANGLVLFNRFYQPDLDIDELEVKPHLALSTSADLLLPLRWIAILHNRIAADLALTSGMHHGVDMVKGLMAGAAVVMVASELIEKGIPRAQSMIDELSEWMDAHEYESVTQMRGSMSQRSVAEPAAFERANYMKALTLFDNRY
jgi:dihydroorotate dehydrogenase (fumarate)